MVYGDQGSSLDLVSRYALSLLCTGTVILVVSALSPSFCILGLMIPSLSVAAEGCLTLSAVEPDFGVRVGGGIAA